MPKVSTVADIAEMDDKDVVKLFRGKVVSQFDWSSWKDEDKSGSFENLIVQDRAGDKIKVVLKDREPIGNIKGKDITILAHSGAKGFSGCYVFDQEYKGKSSRNLKVTPTGEIVFGNSQMHGESDSENAGEEDYKPEKKPAREHPEDYPNDETQSPPKGSANANALANARVFLARRRNGYLLCLDAAVSAGKEYGLRHPEMGGMSAEHFHGMTSTIYIGAERAGIFDDLPVTPLAPVKKDENTK